MGDLETERKGRGSEPDGLRLRPFDARHAPAVLGWITSDEEARRWASLGAAPSEPAVLARWHAEPDVRPYLLEERGTFVGYGEIWEDEKAAEAELARIVVEPTRRGRGLGRVFVGLLIAEARRIGFRDVWLRVVPDNHSAVACYRAAGFTRATPDEERAFNAGQPHEYVWMRAPPITSPP